MTTDQGICAARFSDEMHIYIVQSMPQEMPMLAMRGTPFQTKVWEELLKIPAGSVITYQELAVAIGRPKAWRAVARAVATNSIAYFIPCHRVIRKNGELGGYRWGRDKKIALLKSEGFFSC